MVVAGGPIQAAYPAWRGDGACGVTDTKGPRYATSMLRTGRSRFLGVTLALTTLVSGSHAAPPTPILVELFTSEGCEDCPPADKVLEQLIRTQPASGADIIGVGEHVDYWDRLGWKDRFSSAALTKRQGLYAARFGNGSIYTPQMVVDGRMEFVGSDAAAARRAIGKAIAQSHGVIGIVARPFPASADAAARLAEAPEARRRQGRDRRDAESVALQVRVSDLPKITHGDQADIVVAITEDGLRSDVTRGENKGRTLTHAAVARYMATIGGAAAAGPSSASADIAIAPDWQRDQLKVIAFVQERASRRILAAAALPLKNVRP
ncbi:MAG: DUF1223 domain-containing protein [Acidobacteria bacterium]|nr:DUF1223 domain-containing protein [Acidobacteriota bacterium]